MKRVFAHIGFSMAVALVVLNLLRVDMALVASMGLAMLLVASLLIPKIRQAVAVPLCLGSALFACLVFMCSYSINITPQAELEGKTVNADFYYVDIPEQGNGVYTYVVKTIDVHSPNSPQNIKLRIFSGEEINAEPYQVINADLKFGNMEANAFDSCGGWANGVFLSASVKSHMVRKDKVFSPLKWAYRLRVHIINVLCGNLKGDIGSLSASLVTGYKNGISDSLYSAFKQAGVAHLLAVSGFHLTIMTGGLFFVLRLLRVNEKITAVAGSLFIIICIGLAGFSKSIIRAGIMLVVMLIGSAVKRRADALNSLGIAVSLICLNPFAVADVGAQLSVMATLSLIVVAMLVKDSEHKRVWSFALTPPAVMLFTLPSMYISFGYVSLIGLVSGIFVTPLGSASIVASLLTFSSDKLGFMSELATSLANYIISALIWLVRWFASFPLAVVSLPYEFGFVIAGIFALIIITAILKKKSWVKPVSVIVVCVLALSLSACAVADYCSAGVLVTENGACAVVDKNEAVVFNIKNKKDYYSIKSWLFAHHIVYDDSFENSPSFDVCEEDGTVRINGVTISFNADGYDNADVFIGDGFIYDKNGLISLEKGDIIYNIYYNSYYEAHCRSGGALWQG